MTPERDTPWPMDDAVKRLHVSRASLYREIGAGHLRLTKIRGRSFIMESECQRYLKARTDGRRAA